MKVSRWMPALLVILAVAGTAYAADLPPLKVEKYELPNGLDVKIGRASCRERV